jgi:hypothetical protein
MFPPSFLPAFIPPSRFSIHLQSQGRLQAHFSATGIVSSQYPHPFASFAMSPQKGIDAVLQRLVRMTPTPTQRK